MYQMNWVDCNLVWNHTIWNQKYDCRPKLHNTKFQLPLYYTHFEIPQFFVNINIYFMFTSGKPVLSFDGLKKECDLEQKNGNKLHCWETVNQISWMTSDFKMGVINSLTELQHQSCRRKI